MGKCGKCGITTKFNFKLCKKCNEESKKSPVVKAKKETKQLRKWGYKAHKTEDGKIKTDHSEIGENKYGYESIPKNFVIHHIDSNKENNQPYNLILIHRKDHRRIHLRKTLVIRSKRSKEE